MAATDDPTAEIRAAAAAFAGVDTGATCTQTSFKAGKGTFLFIGPGAKGRGFKALFKLRGALDEARALAAAEPTRFEVGSTGWVTARFTAEAPLPKRIWSRWLADSYDVTCGGGAKPAAQPAAKKPSPKRPAKKTSRRGD